MEKYAEGFLTRTRRRNATIVSSQNDVELGSDRPTNDVFQDSRHRHRRPRKPHRQGSSETNWITPILLSLAVFFFAILFLYVTLLLVVTTEIEESKINKQALRKKNRADDKFENVYVNLSHTCDDGTVIEYLGIPAALNFSSDLMNDDYCDCPDGSDEIRTSACSHVNTNDKLFPCNDGESIFLSRVGDGIVDCSDGSDEI